jgi:putative glutamine amidotransferase
MAKKTTTKKTTKKPAPVARKSKPRAAVQGVPAADMRTGDREPRPPIIGISPDISEPSDTRLRAEVSMFYADAIARAGGVPMVLTPRVGLIGAQLACCDGVVLTGGGDPRMEAFGFVTHAQAKPMHAIRQEFDTRLIQALQKMPDMPVLGICLGMQMMSLLAGGRLNQHLPDTLATAEQHAGNSRHGVTQETKLPRGMGAGPPAFRGVVTSSHHQAVDDPGSLTVIARSDDGVVEAVMDIDRPFYLGVQWHPERTDDAALGDEVFVRLVRAAEQRQRSRA